MYLKPRSEQEELEEMYAFEEKAYTVSGAIYSEEKSERELDRMEELETPWQREGELF